MKRYALHDATSEESGTLALLEYYERDHTFYFELPPHADPWELPFILHEFAQKGEPTIDAQWSMRWVQSRLVPTERQNLGEILRVNALDSYDERRLLDMTGGRCSQDDCYLVPIRDNQAPAWYEERLATRIADVYALGHSRLLVLFRDGDVILCNMADLLKDDLSYARVLKDETVFSHVQMQSGGHGVRWGTSLLVSCNMLRKGGSRIRLDAGDVASLASQAVLDTAEVAQLLGCSRQNVSDLVRRGKLMPLKTTSRGPLFLRSDIYMRLNS